MAGKRMMEKVKEAQVVITNPTHLAVALQYKKNMRAPVVLAKGAGHIAKKIVERARSHGVPVMQNKPLARHLFRWVEINDEIPSTLYQAVAGVLAYVYKLKNSSTRYNHAAN